MGFSKKQDTCSSIFNLGFAMNYIKVEAVQESFWIQAKV